MKLKELKMKNLLHINTDFVKEILCRFINLEVTKVGAEGVVIGLSGGIDSSTVAFLSKEAMGKEKVLGCMMPYKTSNLESILHAKKVVEILQIESMELDITPMVDSYFEKFPDANLVRKGNFMARQRMAILYDISHQKNYLVIGTSNKTEILLGYGTIFGDTASALNPVGDLYKTQLKQLAKALGLPLEIINKKPTADLWPGQTDEGELGITYEEVDRLLYYMIDERVSYEQLLELGFKETTIERISSLVKKMQFKRKPPLIAKISKRTVDYDFQYARDWGS